MRLKVKRFFKGTVLFKRNVFFELLALFTFFLRYKSLDKHNVKNILVIAQKRMGDTVVSIPTFRAIRKGFPFGRIFAFANTYVQDILERIDSVDEIVTYDPGLPLNRKVKVIRSLSHTPIDLAIDLTCDYTFEGAWLAFESRAKYRVGYNTYGRGFLFNKAVPHEKKPLHITDEILAIVQSIDLDTENKSLSLTASDLSQKESRHFLRENGVEGGEKLVGIHPGGYYPTQRWPTERFVELADELIKRHKIKIVLMGGPKEEELIRSLSKQMKNEPIIFLNQPIRNLLALIQFCSILICNNSGPLHLATALGTPTVSMMGPTLPERWWPQGQEHLVLRKDLPCMPCNDGFCKIETFDCMGQITVEEVLEAVEKQMSKREGN